MSVMNVLRPLIVFAAIFIDFEKIILCLILYIFYNFYD